MWIQEEENEELKVNPGDLVTKYVPKKTLHVLVCQWESRSSDVSSLDESVA